MSLSETARGDRSSCNARALVVVKSCAFRDERCLRYRESGGSCRATTVSSPPVTHRAPRPILPHDRLTGAVTLPPPPSSASSPRAAVAQPATPSKSHVRRAEPGRSAISPFSMSPRRVLNCCHAGPVLRRFESALADPRRFGFAVETNLASDLAGVRGDGSRFRTKRQRASFLFLLAFPPSSP
jgi:hypothetical protein